MARNRIYLDNNATTAIAEEVVAAMLECYRDRYGNASSQHSEGQRARNLWNRTLDRTARALGCQVGFDAPHRLIVTSGATESNHLAILGYLNHFAAAGTLLTSQLEHPSLIAAAQEARRQGHSVVELQAQSSGHIDLDDLKFQLTQQADVRLVSIICGNHETGVIQPQAEIYSLCQAHGVALHTDATQWIGKRVFSFADFPADLISFSGHKIHGPRGIGGLLTRQQQLSPLFVGGFQQAGLRAGTEPLELLIGMREAIELAQANIDERQTGMAELRDRFEQQVTGALPDVVVNGVESERLPHVSNVSFCGVDRQAMLMALDLQGIACSTGAACASGSSELSPVLRVMGLDLDRQNTALRFSLSCATTIAEIEQAVSCISRIYNSLRQAS